jgi:serine/threonine protein kinase
MTKTKSNYYIFTEMCNGGDLSKFCQIRGGLKEREAKTITRQIVSGLTAIKQKKIMHRDLKLQNLLVHFTKLD